LYFRHPFASGLALILLAAVVFFLFHRNPRHGDWDAFLGTWTEEQGEPGNYISFGLVDVTPPNSIVSLQEGRAIFHRQLGEEHTEVLWNYGNLEPLELNVLVTGKCQFAGVRMLDADHMLIRFTNDFNAPLRSDFFDGPEVKRMSRERRVKRD
jgi:hypothetical protein